MEGRRQSTALTGVYRERLAQRQAAAARLDQRHGWLAWSRLALFAAAMALLVTPGLGGWVAIPIVVFIPLAFAHAGVLNERDRATRAAAFYERGLARLEHRWQGRGQSGERFRDATHLYADDLDLFGAGSLFELLATARTSGGEEVLAAWLKTSTPADEIRSRQLAVEELAGALDFREEIAVIGPEIVAGVSTSELRKWALSPPGLTERWPLYVLPIVGVVALWSVGDFLWRAMAEVPEPRSVWLVPSLLLVGFFSYRFRHRIHHVSHEVQTRERELQLLALLMERLEGAALSSPRLQALQQRLRATGRPPALEVRRLARLVEILSSMHNLVFGPIAFLLLLPIQIAFAVERWRTRSGHAVPQWLDAVAEFEALCAIGTYRSEHAEDPFPELASGDPVFEATAVAHPLLASSVAVPNDVALGAPHPALLVVSGSNMSGKSTLLRTIGLNVVLAHLGAPVRAQRLRLTPLAIGATLRIQDSLQEGRSRFFAEISRISEVVALAKLARSSDGSPVLFLFDELLAGTNSHDRLQGGTGILKGLLELGAIGLVTTHDLALTAIVDGLEERAANVHFQDRFVDGTLHFDYKLRPGVVRTGNAIPLMRSVGLDV